MFNYRKKRLPSTLSFGAAFRILNWLRNLKKYFKRVENSYANGVIFLSALQNLPFGNSSNVFGKNIVSAIPIVEEARSRTATYVTSGARREVFTRLISLITFSLSYFDIIDALNYYCVWKFRFIVLPSVSRVLVYRNLPALSVYAQRAPYWLDRKSWPKIEFDNRASQSFNSCRSIFLIP